jgi:hypothetical protein
MKGVLKVIWLIGVLLSIGAAVIYYVSNEAAKRHAQTSAARAARWRKTEPETEPEPQTEPETETETVTQ